MALIQLDITNDNGIQLIKLNAQRTKNALTHQMYEGITNALNSADNDDSVMFSVITGCGEYFSSGTHLGFKSFNENGYNDYVERATAIVKNFVSAFINYSKLVIAVVNGPAIGIGVTILGLCDIVFASHRATFQLPFMKLGLCPEACSSYTFPRIMGPSKAGHLLYLGYKMNAEEAFNCGLVGHLFDDSQIDKIFVKLKLITTFPKNSLSTSKKLLRGWNKELLHEVNEKEMVQVAQCLKSDTFINALLSKL
uniref:Enoyl-CoA delta isomerase 2, mitochondrial n=1 Tax=Clastoptera arizonana TaxID=38151 RepID=A0A1B6CM18_9HEMI